MVVRMAFQFICHDLLVIVGLVIPYSNAILYLLRIIFFSTPKMHQCMETSYKDFCVCVGVKLTFFCFFFSLRVFLVDAGAGARAGDGAAVTGESHVAISDMMGLVSAEFPPRRPKGSGAELERISQLQSQSARVLSVS